MKDNFDLDDTSTSKSKSEMLIKLRGFTIAILSALTFALSQIYVKKGTIVSGSEQSLIRYIQTLITMLVIARWMNYNVCGEKDTRKLLMLNAFAANLNVICLTFGIKLIDPSDANSLFNTKIILVLIIARIFLKEKITITYVLALFIMVFGVILITKPSFIYEKPCQLSKNINGTIKLEFQNENKTSSIKSFVGVLLVLVSATGSAFSSIIMKKMTNKSVHFSVTLLYVSYSGVPLSLLISLVLIATGSRNTQTDLNALESFSSLQQIVYSLIASSLGIASQCLYNISLNYEDATRASIYKSTDLFFIFIFQYALLDITPDVLKTFGALLIFLSSLIVMIFKILDAKHSTTLTRIEKKDKYYYQEPTEQQQQEENVENENRKEEEISLIKRVIFYKF
jgi:drug/metabolite transporter (DMT)-like permease